ncbi:DUF4184 family protein [Noviherbaspirillum sedimenti]|uniref:DUF4184 family protein n=1 Tax=Noviherbaspirillum sedimenti TaxID=2320865 RepID=A0A3A3G597_9BURK|nr:DUF4184 family protein [Noviherbaspirillum sedimenti]RJG03683.1 DUF4184 family protein [Noviherbaspirillum sedimenti]
MPFTFAHPAAVIPLHWALRRHVVLSALVIGSMAPDFQNFLPFDVDRSDSHSLAGMFWFCLPLGMLLYLAFHLLLKKPLCELLPPAVAARLAVTRPAPLLPSVSGQRILLSLLLGIVTHLAWDAFTHYGFLSVFILPFLSTHLFSVGSYHVYPYKLLQHASTVGGVLLLWHWTRCWLRQAAMPQQLPPTTLASRNRLTIIGILLAAPPLVGTGMAAQAFSVSYEAMALQDVVREAVVTAISSFGLLLIAYSLVWHMFLFQRNRSAT